MKMEISKSGTAVFVGLMMMTAGFVLTLAGWFAPPITDTVFRVRMAGPVTLLLGFVLLVFSYILCAIEQEKCSECCYQYIRAREKENDIRSCDMDSMMTSPNGMHIDHVITQNHVTSQEPHSIPDQIQILQQRLAQLQMNQEALLHPGLNYVYNPLIAAYSLHPTGQDTQNSNGHVQKKGSDENHDQMEAIISKNSHIPFIDDPSSDTSGQNDSESNSNNCEDAMDTLPPLRGHIVKLPRPKKGSKHKNSKSKSTGRNFQFSNVIKNSNAEEFHDPEDLWPKRRQSKKELLSSLSLHSKKSTEDGNGALHLIDYYSQMRDTSKSTGLSTLEHRMPSRVSTSERLSLCVPITPDSEGELTDKLEGLSTNSSFTSELSPQTNGTTKNNSRENLGHVIVNIGTSPYPLWHSAAQPNKENCDSTEKSQLLPKEIDRSSHSYSRQLDFSKPSTVKVMASSEYVHRNTAVAKKPGQQKNVMSLDLVSHIQVTSPNLQKPITSVKPLPKNLSSPQSLKVLPLKSPRQPVARARIIKQPDCPYSEMADSTV